MPSYAYIAGIYCCVFVAAAVSATTGGQSDFTPPFGGFTQRWPGMPGRCSVGPNSPPVAPLAISPLPQLTLHVQILTSSFHLVNSNFF